MQRDTKSPREKRGPVSIQYKLVIEVEMIDKCKLHEEEKEKLFHLRRMVDLLTSAKIVLFFTVYNTFKLIERVVFD